MLEPQKPPSQSIRGNTMKVYLFLVKTGPSDLREIQRGVGLSTPSLASYHLGKLVEYGYVKQDEKGRYLSTSGSTAQILEGYSKVGTSVVPQLFFFAVLFTALGGFFSYETLFGNGYAAYLVAIVLAMVATIWFETFRLWRRLVGE